MVRSATCDSCVLDRRTCRDGRTCERLRGSKGLKNLDVVSGCCAVQERTTGYWRRTLSRHRRCWWPGGRWQSPPSTGCSCPRAAGASLRSYTSNERRWGLPPCCRAPTDTLHTLTGMFPVSRATHACAHIHPSCSAPFAPCYCARKHFWLSKELSLLCTIAHLPCMCSNNKH